ncbi:modification methylase [Coprinopsis cinerea okayama7|uniref:Modification methylase n=1 Tax=Coprinopsis cinerea (strain Okayama-7 / 130 / ATCC MYA-4618 / FGSC 9003) TaxID=240176 RepID=D6RLQ5_COPC7|nr:modification methylase [Coprinopsis cinerea okayama7\|eukprot:XP_002911717.1 modification methylase [Coprinopsis cinerea okayama7\
MPLPLSRKWSIVAHAANPCNTSWGVHKSLLDLGTGSGCIPLLLCRLWPQGSLSATGVDISPHALSLANENAALCGIPPRSDSMTPRNTFRTSLANFLANDFPGTHLSSALPIDILISNPPYIPWDEYLELPESVVNFEDPKALFGGPSGLEHYEAIARLLTRPGGIRHGSVHCLKLDSWYPVVPMSILGLSSFIRAHAARHASIPGSHRHPAHPRTPSLSIRLLEVTYPQARRTSINPRSFWVFHTTSRVVG